jgi:hypothetical protein
MIKDFKFFQEPKKIRWVTANGLSHPIEYISVDHIASIIRYMEVDGNMRIPNPYEGRTHSEWIDIFHNEIERRRN